MQNGGIPWLLDFIANTGAAHQRWLHVKCGVPLPSQIDPYFINLNVFNYYEIEVGIQKVL